MPAVESYHIEFVELLFPNIRDMGCLNIKITSSQNRYSRYKGKTVLRQFYIYSENHILEKTVFILRLEPVFIAKLTEGLWYMQVGPIETENYQWIWLIKSTFKITRLKGLFEKFIRWIIISKINVYLLKNHQYLRGQYVRESECSWRWYEPDMLSRWWSPDHVWESDMWKLLLTQ